jgi:hypothetical protein
MHMPKQIGSFILPDIVMSSMRDRIKETRKLKIELGFALCTDKGSNIITKGPECIGTKCSIKEGSCKEGYIQIGNYHTHPRTDATMSITDMVTGCSENIQCIGSTRLNNIVCFSRKTEEYQCLKDTSSFEDEEHEILQKGSELREILYNPKSIMKIGIYNTLKELKRYDDRVFKYNANRIRLLHRNFDRIGI